MTSWPERVQKWRKSHFARFGLPFLTLVVGGSFLTVEFQRVKYEARADRQGKRLLEEYGINTKIDLKEEVDKVSEATKNFQWRNIRGPRPYEDSTEFFSLRESQERNIQEAMVRAEKTVAEKKSEKVD